MVGQSGEQPQAKKVHCAQCHGIRNCEVRAVHRQDFNDGYADARTDWYILECRGCDNVFVQTISTNDDDCMEGVDEDGDLFSYYVESVKYWPSLAKRTRPAWLRETGLDGVTGDVARNLYIVLTELYTALDGDLRMLAGIGIRTAFDVASEALHVEPHLSFGQKLQTLVERNFISLTERGRLDVLVDAGNAAAHRGWRPDQSEITTLMDILEHFIETLLVNPAKRRALDQEAANLKARVPIKIKPRKK